MASSVLLSCGRRSRNFMRLAQTCPFSNVWSEKNRFFSHASPVSAATTTHMDSVFGTSSSSAASMNGSTGLSVFETSDFSDSSTYVATMKPPHEAFTLHPSSYYSTKFFEEEKTKVFEKSWVCIGLADQVRVPGDTIVANLGRQPIFAVRDKHGSLNGFLNVCRHRGSKLVKTCGRNSVISCPYHRWGYALDGRLIATPLWDTVQGGKRFDRSTGELKDSAKQRRQKKNQDPEVAAAQAAIEQAEHDAACEPEQCDGQSQELLKAYSTDHIKAFRKEDYSLFKVRVQEWGPFVFATLAEPHELGPVDSVLEGVVNQLSNYPLADLVTVRTKQYNSKANWKLLVENFMEYMHLPTVHPALVKVSSVDAHKRQQSAGQYVGFITSPLSRGGQPIDTGILPSMPGIQGTEHNTGVFHGLFPNVFYFLLPSHIFIVRLEPVSPTETIEHTSLLVHPSVVKDMEAAGEKEKLDKILDDMMSFYDTTNIEDIVVCEGVQEGVKCRSYQGGRVSFRFEETIHRFQNILIDYMTGKGHRVPLGDENIPFYIGGMSDESAAASIKAT